MAYLLGMDLSHWKWPTNISDLVAAGGRFVYAKATEHTNFVDENFDEYRAQADELKLPFGGFHYFRVAYDPIEQARHFYSVASGTFLTPVIDVEKANNAGLASKELFTNKLKACLDEVQALWGKTPMIYSSQSHWFELTTEPVWSLGYPLWVANYEVETPKLPRPWSSWVLWQFTDRYAVAGKTYDANYFNGDQAAFDAYFGAPMTLPKLIQIKSSNNVGVRDKPGGAAFSIAFKGWQFRPMEAVEDANGKLWYNLGPGWVPAANVTVVEP